MMLQKEIFNTDRKNVFCGERVKIFKIPMIRD